MIVIIVFLDFLYVFLNIGGRGRFTEFFLRCLAVSERCSQAHWGLGPEFRLGLELGGRGPEVRQGRPQGAQREAEGGAVVGLEGGGRELGGGGAGLGELEAGEHRLGPSTRVGVKWRLEREQKLGTHCVVSNLNSQPCTIMMWTQ